MKAFHLAVMVSALPVAAVAGQLEDRMKAFVDSELRSKLSEPMIVNAIKDANSANMSLTAQDILAVDEQWKAAVGTDSALIKGVVETPLSDALRDYVAASGGKITEVIVMDAKGLNVGASDVTSDYWQGDEDKYQLSYAIGPDGIHFSEVEFDESTQSYQLQVSFTITDPATGLGIGAATIGLNAEAF